jgi:hypothetical protein
VRVKVHRWIARLSQTLTGINQANLPFRMAFFRLQWNFSEVPKVKVRRRAGAEQKVIVAAQDERI